uniref:Ig-like domain-containing protein n=1 Tax=Paramormyrops kingsleyae TaxID=1676925 RepID=A0A3B3TAS4_9TELE
TSHMIWINLLYNLIGYLSKPISFHSALRTFLCNKTATSLVEWKKTDDDGDILVLLYDDGENRPESQDGRYYGRAEFFTEEIPKGNFSMKLRKVRTEDKGEFRCEVHSDTDSASTTARIFCVIKSHIHSPEGQWLCCTLIISTTSFFLGEITSLLSFMSIGLSISDIHNYISDI